MKRSNKGWDVYKGPSALIIAIDLGTTFSGASFCILQAGVPPRINDVMSFPGQRTASSKVASKILYDSSGKPRLFGAEASGSAASEQILDRSGAIVQWWKLAMRPKYLEVISKDEQGKDITAILPFGLQPETVTSHFLGYMASCVGSYIQSRYPSGAEVLAQLAGAVRYIITIPNGWELAQQEAIRKACIDAGLIMPEQQSSVSFVTEAEASINFCTMMSESSHLSLERDDTVIVADCGGGTIDVSSYTVNEVQPCVRLSEASISDCIIAGSATIDIRAKAYIAERLQGTSWSSEEELTTLQEIFSSSIKEVFQDVGQDYYLPIGRVSDNDEERRIKRGKLIMSGEEVAQLFEPSLDAIEKSIKSKIVASSTVATCAMVGGFAESAYLRRELQKRLGNKINIYKPDEATSKAVAKGAIAWFLDGVVGSRKSKMHYGIRCATIFRPHKASHFARSSQVIVGNDGVERLKGFFGQLLEKDSIQDVNYEHIQKYSLTWPVGETLYKEIGLVVYRGEEEKAPDFVDEVGFETLCKFRIDMEPFRPVLQVRKGKTGIDYVYAPIKLAIKLSGTEITAQTIYEHGTQVFRGPVMVFTEPQVHS